MNPTTWRSLVDLGIAARLPTRRGCRGGSRKQRAITRVVGCRPPTDRTRTRPCCVNLVQVPISRLPETVSKTKFALINARSLRNKALLVRDYVDDRFVDVAAITETWLADEGNASVSELWRDNLTIAHQPRGGARRGGGVGILFRKSFQLVSRVSVDTCASETLSVTLRNAHIDCTTRVIVMYRPPSSCFKTFLDDVFKVLLIAAAHPTETIVCGDFNTRYKDPTCTDVINLADLVDTSGFVQHVSGATHERGNILDLIVTAKTSNLLTTPVSPTTLLTDHYSLECDLNVVKPERPKRRVRYRKFASIDKRAFTADIRDAFAVTSGTTVQSIDNYITAIEAIVNKHAPVVTRVIADRRKNCPVRNVTSVAPKADGERQHAVHRQIYTTLRDEYRRQLAATKASHLCTVIREAGYNMKTMFGVTNALLGRSVPAQLPETSNDVALAETFQQFFVEKITDIRRSIDSRAVTTTTFDRQPCDDYQPAQLCEFTPATTADIRRIILQSSAKSGTLDPMPTSLLKENIDILVPFYTVIVNSSLESGVVPAAMNHAIVTPILKKRGLDVNCLTNYRLISNLTFLSKTLQRYVASELRHYLDTNGFNDPFQSAYRPKHSTETALVRIHEDLIQAVDSGRGVLLVLLDLSAAFDTLVHSTLLCRLRAIGLNQTMLAWFSSYLIGRTNAVKIREVTSAPVITQHGVPQGSVLGPLLFNIYFLPITDIFDRHQIRYDIYADDTQLYAECPPSSHADAQRKIEKCVSDIRQWLDYNHLLLNEAKTEAIFFVVHHLCMRVINVTVANCS